jgi:hypothetical protein
MTARRALAAAVGTLACMALPASAADAATRQQAQTKARQAANHYTNAHFGIGFATGDGWRHWSATCTRRPGGGWRCSVSMQGGQCAGTLKLSAALRPFAHRIACSE